MATPTNILIASSDTGGGHRSAARALQDAIACQSSNSHPIQSQIIRVLEEASFLTRQLANLYNWLLRHRQDWVQYYFRFIDTLRPNESVGWFRRLRSYGRKLLTTHQPDIIISVHPMLQHFFAYLLQEYQMSDRIRLVTVVTDPGYGFWRGWACQDVQQYFVASEAAKQQLVDYGIDRDKILVSGMPIHPDFQPANLETKTKLRSEYSLHPDKFTLLVNAGWIGGGNVPKIFDTLLQQAANLDIQVVFLAGKNRQLANQARQKLAQHDVKSNIFVMEFMPSIHQLMQLSDAMVSKLGGLTTFEAMACELPLIADTVTSPMPQEAATAQWLQDQEMAIFLQRPEDIVGAIASLVESPQQREKMAQLYRTHAKTQGATTIAREILHRQKSRKTISL